MKSYLLALLFLLSHLEASTQTGLIKSIEINNIKQVTIDRAADIYVITEDRIIKLDKDGRQIHETKISHPLTSFDTGNGVHLLCYDRSHQQYTILSPSLTKVSESSIDQSIAIDPFLVCSSGDYNILILDAADWSIKKADTREARVLSEFKMDSTVTESTSFKMMREYQNFIFLLDKHVGITIFNSLGIKIKSLNIPDLQSFNFLGQELYYYKNGNIHFFDLFTAETRSEPLLSSFDSVILTDERLVGVKPQHLEIYTYNSK